MSSAHTTRAAATRSAVAHATHLNIKVALRIDSKDPEVVSWAGDGKVVAEHYSERDMNLLVVVRDASNGTYSILRAFRGLKPDGEVGPTHVSVDCASLDADTAMAKLLARGHSGRRNPAA